MRVLIELARITFIFVFIGGIFSALINFIYEKLGVNTDTYGWIAMMAILIYLFVMYRNKYQFSGWYTGKGREKLPKIAAKLLISISILLLLLPPFLSFF